MNLRDLYETLATEERNELAAKAGVSSAYLWQLATQWKGKKPSLALLKKLVDSDRRLDVSDLVAEFTGLRPAPMFTPENNPGRRATDPLPAGEGRAQASDGAGNAGAKDSE